MNEQELLNFAEKVAQDQAVASGAALSYLGDTLGIWAALAAAGPVTSEELAAHTGLAERYLREWLSAEAAAGYIRYDPDGGRFTLPPEHAAVLADDDSPAALAGGFEFIAALWLRTDRLAEAFWSGGGVAWHEHDAHLFRGVERSFRPLYRAALLQEWLPALDGVVDHLQRGARALDVGCGYGSATIIMAEAYPGSRFVGVDNHPPSITAARHAASVAGVQDRVEFLVADAATYDTGTYDLVCFFDTLHDLGDPVGAAAHARAALGQDGTLLLVEPLAHDRTEDNLNPVGLTYYTASTFVCVPNSLSQPVGLALGAQAGEHRLREVLTAAGFTRVRRAAATDFNLVLEAKP